MQLPKDKFASILNKYLVVILFLPLFVTLILTNNSNVIVISTLGLAISIGLVIASQYYPLHFLAYLFLLILSAFDQQLFLIRSTEVLLYCLLLILMATYAISKPKPPLTIRNIPLLNNFLLFIILVFLSTAVSFTLPYDFPMVTTIMQFERWLVFFAIFIVTFKIVNTKERISTVIAVIISLGTIISLISINDFFFPSGVGLIGLAVPRARAIFANPNALSGYLELVAPIALGYYIFSTVKRLKWLCFISFMLMMTAITVTFTRGAYLGVLTLFVFTLISIRKRAVKFIPVIAVLFLVIFLSPIGDFVFVRFTPRGFDISILVRLVLWQSALINTLHYPIFGIGPAHFKTVFETQAIQNLKSFGALGHVHNAYLEIALGIGVIALVVFVVMKVRFIRMGIKYLKAGGQGSMYAIVFGIVGGSIAISFHELFEYFFRNFEVSILYWTLLAILARIYFIRISAHAD